MFTLDNVLTALGIASVPTGAGIKGFLSLRDRIAKVESKQSSDEAIVLVKLDAIANKIDLRCDSLDQRLERVERKVLNGDYHK